MKPRHIATVSLLVPDYEPAIEFFVEALRFSLVEDSLLPEGKRWVLVAPPGHGNTRLLLARATTPEEQAAIGNQAGGRVFLFLSTDDFDGDFAHMKAAGVEFLEAARQEPYGKVAIFCDPFGNKWDLIQPAEPEPGADSGF